MKSVIIIGEKGADKAYGDGITDATKGPNSLASGSIALVTSDGLVVPRGTDQNAKALNTNTTLAGITKDQHACFITKTPSGLRKGVSLVKGKTRYSKVTYAAAVKQVSTITISEANAVVGQYASLEITDKSVPSYRRTSKTYSVLLNATNTASATTLVTALKAEIAKDPHACVVPTGTDTLILTGVHAGIGFVVTPTECIQGNTVTLTTAATGTPGAERILEEEMSNMSREGVNKHSLAADLSNVISAIDTSANYTIFVAESSNTEGPDFSVEFPLVQIIAVPTTATLLLSDIEALLKYLSGDESATVVWGGA